VSTLYLTSTQDVLKPNTQGSSLESIYLGLNGDKRQKLGFRER
jgi:hypothetical protein